jgi:hypothetical protein
MTSSASLPISKYRLDMDVDDLPGLIDFSETEYILYGRNFEGEKDYNAPGIDFLRHHLKVALGTVWGKVRCPSFGTSGRERVYIKARGCGTGFGVTMGL